MNKPVFWMVIAANILCLSCRTFESAKSSGLSEDPPSQLGPKSEHYQSDDLSWLDYVDPKADANIAIEKGDFRLLAFSGRARSFPGIENHANQLQQQCGYQLLANSSDAVDLETGLGDRKKLYLYAAAYNQIVSSACYNKNAN